VRQQWVQDTFTVMRFTRHFLHYGILIHVFVCALVAAVEGLSLP